MSTVLPSPLLRTGLRLDAVLSLTAAALVPLMIDLLMREIGLARGSWILLAAFMFAWAGLTGWMGGQTRLPVWSVWLAIAVNIEWAVASLLLPTLAELTPSPLGWTVLILQAAGVLVFAELQWLGLRRSQRESALVAAASGS